MQRLLFCLVYNSNDMKIAVIGSGLSALGALSALNGKKLNIDLYRSVEIVDESPKHRLYLKNRKLIIHKSVKTLEGLRKIFEENNSLRVKKGTEICGLLSSNYIGGLSNFWGGSSNKIMDFEKNDFKDAGLDISGHYEKITEFINSEIISDEYYRSDNSESEKDKWLSTINLNNHQSSSIFSSFEFLKNLEINQIDRHVIDMDQKDTGIKLFHKKGNNICHTEYDYVFVAAGAFASPILAGRLKKKSFTTGLYTNDQRIFLASYKLKSPLMKFLKAYNGPPSLLVNFENQKFYIQLYPIKKLYPLKLLSGQEMMSNGYLIGYIYNQSKNSNHIEMKFHDGNLELEVKKNRTIQNKKKEIQRILSKDGIKLISPLVSLSTGSSQHIASSLCNPLNELNNLGSLTNDFCFKDYERVFFLDSSVFPYSPLCTIGLTAMTSSHYITEKILNNL